MDFNFIPDRIDYIKTIDGTIIRPKRYVHAGWNMDNGSNFSFTHGLSDITKIVDVSIMILNDAGTKITPLCMPNFAAGTGIVDGGIIDFDAMNIWCWRRTGGFYDNANYSTMATDRVIAIVWTQE